MLNSEKSLQAYINTLASAIVNQGLKARLNHRNFINDSDFITYLEDIIEAIKLTPEERLTSNIVRDNSTKDIISELQRTRALLKEYNINPNDGTVLNNPISQRFITGKLLTTEEQADLQKMLNLLLCMLDNGASVMELQQRIMGLM